MVRILNESGHERNRNAGDEAYFATMVTLFRQAINPVEIEAFSARPKHDKKRYQVKAIYSGGSLRKSIKSVIEIFKAIKRCDIYIWGAGQILRDDNFIFSPPYRLSRPLLAMILGKPVMAFGVGIGPLEKRSIRFLAKLALRKFTVLSYRDETTGRILKGLGLSDRSIVKTVDPAFALQPEDSTSVDTLLTQLGFDDRKQTLIGVAPFGPAFRGKFSGIRNILPAKFQAERDIWQKGGKERYTKHVKLLADFYDRIVKIYKAKLIFVIQDASGQGLDDRITNDIIANLKHPSESVVLNADDYPPSLIKGLMGRMEIVTGGRMHSLILASGIATPVMAICYEQKIKALADVINQPGCFIDGYTVDNTSQLLELFNRIWNSRDLISRQLADRDSELVREVNRNVDRLKRILIDRQVLGSSSSHVDLIRSFNGEAIK